MKASATGHDHHTVIIGGGFGGLYAAKALARTPVQVTMLDRRNFHLFQPLLYQVATGGLSPADIAAPLRSILGRQKNAGVLLAEAVDLAPDRRQVILSEGTVDYDTLVVAAGARNDYFGNNEWGPYAPGLKSIEDATEIRRRVLYAFEAAEREPSPEARNAWLTFVVVGAGPTGVELAGTLGEIANDTLRRDFRSIRPEESSVLLLDAAPRVLPTYPPELSKKAERDLIRLAVRPRTGVSVTSIDAGGVTFRVEDREERIASRTVLWAAGVAASPFGRVLADRTGCELDKKGRVIVEPDLTVPGQSDIFVIGDLASCQGADGKALPGVAPVAMQQGEYVARVIERRLDGRETEPFRYRDRGSLATIGRSRAVACIGRFRFSGMLAWLAWLFVHLMYLAGFQNRLLVMVQWAFHYFSFNRMARLILPEKRSSSQDDQTPNQSV